MVGRCFGFAGACVYENAIRPVQIAFEVGSIVRNRVDAFVKASQIALAIFELAVKYTLIPNCSFGKTFYALNTMDSLVGVFSWPDRLLHPVRYDSIYITLPALVPPQVHDAENPPVQNEENPAIVLNDGRRITEADVNKWSDQSRLAARNCDDYKENLVNYICNKELKDHPDPAKRQLLSAGILVAQIPVETFGFQNMHNVCLRLLEGGSAILCLRDLGLAFNVFGFLMRVEFIAKHVGSNQTVLFLLSTASEKLPSVVLLTAVTFFLMCLKTAYDKYVENQEKGLERDQDRNKVLPFATYKSKQRQATILGVTAAAEVILNFATWRLMDAERTYLVPLNFLTLAAKSVGLYDYACQAYAKVIARENKKDAEDYYKRPQIA